MWGTYALGGRLLGHVVEQVPPLRDEEAARPASEAATKAEAARSTAHAAAALVEVAAELKRVGLGAQQQRERRGVGRALAAAQSWRSGGRGHGAARR